jgi:hypothetical protein
MVNPINYLYYQQHLLRKTFFATFLGIVFAKIRSKSCHLKIIAFKFQEPVGDPPDFPQTGFLDERHGTLWGLGGARFWEPSQ